jgi:hypothetical protein
MIRDVNGLFHAPASHLVLCDATPDYRDPRDRRGLVFRLTPATSGSTSKATVFTMNLLPVAHRPRRRCSSRLRPVLGRFWIRQRQMEVADPYYRDGDRVRRDKVQELLDNSPYFKKAKHLA